MHRYEKIIEINVAPDEVFRYFIDPEKLDVLVPNAKDRECIERIERDGIITYHITIQNKMDLDFDVKFTDMAGYKKLDWQLKPPWAGKGNITLEPTTNGTLLRLESEYELPNNGGIMDKALNIIVHKHIQANAAASLDYLKYITEKLCQNKIETVEAH